MSNKSGELNIDKLIEATRLVVGPGNISLHEPIFHGNEREYVEECIESTYVSSVGRFVDRFESELAQYTGSKNAVVVVNGTAALHIALILAGVSEDDEVLLPSLTFVATANAIKYCNAIPHFVDSAEDGFGMGVEKIREHLNKISEFRSGTCFNKITNRRIKAIVPMHVFGHPCDLEGLLKLSVDFKLTMIEDAAESLGSLYYGKHTGTIGLIGALSFNGNKIITTGGGGAILTNDDRLAAIAKHITTTGKILHPWRYTHDRVAYNYRLPNINAALGCAQLEKIEEFIGKKRSLYLRYKEVFSKFANISLVDEPKGCRSNFWLQALSLNQGDVIFRDKLLEASNNSNLMMRPFWDPINTLAPYLNCPSMDLSRSKNYSEKTVNIPSSANL